MRDNTLLTHIPVTRLEIVDGDASDQQMFMYMGMVDKKPFTIKVKLRTDKKGLAFKRPLTITNVTRGTVTGRRRTITVYSFEGTFAGQPVEGTYTSTREGVILPKS